MAVNGSAGEVDSEDGTGEDSEENDSEEERPLRKRKLSLDERRQERAAGDHPLQQRFKELSKSLLKKHTGEGSEGAILLARMRAAMNSNRQTMWTLHQKL